MDKLFKPNFLHVNQKFFVEGKSEDADEFIYSWLNDINSKKILITSDYGTGKSHFCKWLVNTAKNGIIGEKQINFVPLLFDLSTYSIFGNLENLISNSLFQKKSSKTLNIRKIIEEYDKSHVVWIFDSLDESHPFYSHEITSDSFFGQLEELSLKNSKIIVTSRVNWFLNSSKLWGTEKRIEHSSSFFLIVKLKEFTRDDAVEYFRQRKIYSQSDKFVGGDELIKNTQLFSKPIHCQLIFDLFESDGLAEYKINSIYSLYKQSLEKIYKSNNHIEEAFYDQCAYEIAHWMLKQKQYLIDFSQLKYLVGKNAKVKNISINDVIGSLPLTREGNNFKFSHFSWLEYFVAASFIISLKNKSNKYLCSSLLSLWTLQIANEGLQINGKSDTSLDVKWWISNITVQNTITARNVIRFFGIYNAKYLTKNFNSLLKHKSALVKAELLREIRYKKITKKAQDEVRGLLTHSSKTIKYLAIEKCGLAQDSSSVPRIILSFQDKNAAIKRISLWAFKKIRSKKFHNIAISLLQSTNPVAITTASYILGMNQVTKSIKKLESLTKLKHLDKNTHACIIDAIECINNKKFTNWRKEIKNIISDRSRMREILQKGLRWQKRYLIEEIGEQQISGIDSLLIEIYDNEDDTIKYSLIDAIGELRNERNIDFLRAIILAENNSELRLNAVWALGNSNSLKAIDILIETMQDRDVLVKSWSLWSLSQFRPYDQNWNVKSEFFYP